MFICAHLCLFNYVHLCYLFFVKVVPPSIARKPLQPDNKKHPDDDDSCSVASSYPYIYIYIYIFFLFCLVSLFVLQLFYFLTILKNCRISKAYNVQAHFCISPSVPV
ncbi:hypothetical protein HanOQP8_Chr03g0125661 [Helianthus annuus]|nr:hypothetical protein HanOQP8_Chr03g0125661 [Helianthus annuus]